ncbi:MAG: amino acid adenylation domain-containing protein [Tannerella sp.]|jgi:polyketide synthase PksJ|nr:amino acid adenylation domain-containing protein [Tannerella sp.]
MDTLVSIIENTAASTPEKGIVHISHGKEDYFQSYEELYGKSKIIAYILRERGIKPGSVLILSIDKSYHFTLLFWGCILSGIVPAPMPSVKGHQESSVAFRRLMVAMKHLKAPLLISTDNDLSEKLQRSGNIFFCAEDVIRESNISYYDFENYRASADDLAVIQFSSGSTGNPKGVMLSHANILANLALKSKFDRTTRHDVLIHWMPYFHDFGLFGHHLNSIYNMITEIRIDSLTYLRNPLIWLKKITQYNATITGTTPTGMDILLKTLEKTKADPFDLSKIKVLSLGAEMIPASLYERTKEALSMYGFSPLTYRPGYGLAETTLVVSGTEFDAGYKKITLDRKQLAKGKVVKKVFRDDTSCEIVSAGKPFDTIQIRIADENKELSDYHIGEIQVKGNCVMKGYYNNPSADSEAFIDHWLRTGDSGFFDEDKNLYVVGRIKDIIIVNGQNYFPFDLESCIQSHFKDKIEISVFTSYYSDEKEREIVLHFFVPKDKNKDNKECINACNALICELAGFMPDVSIPIRRGNIPKTSSSKTMRKELASMFINGYFTETITTNFQINMKNKILPDMNHKQILSEIWIDALQLSELSASDILSEDNFFALGGDSIRAMRAVAEMESKYQCKLESNFLYKNSTLQKQIDYFCTRNAELVPPACEYELLVREIVCEELNIISHSLSVTDNFISRVEKIGDILNLIQRIKDIFKLHEADEELQKVTNVRQIANLIKKKYKQENGQPFPLMDFQETLYYHSKSFIRNEPTGLSCYIICRTTITGDFRKEYFDRAFNHVIKSHPILHSVITEESETPSMVTLSNYPDFESSYTDISSLSEQEQIRFFEKNDLNDHDHRFDLSLYPLYYSNIFKTGENKHEIVIHIDHQLIDGFSFFEFIHEMLLLYSRFIDREITQEASVLEGLRFYDYVRIEKFRSATKAYGKAMRFALDIFRNVPEKVSIPMQQNPSMLEKVHFNTLHTLIKPEIMHAVIDIAKTVPNISLNSLLLACYFKLMNIWSGQNDLIINMPVYNREQHFPHARKVIGSFLDIFPVRLQTQTSESILSIAQKVENFVRTLLAYPVSSIELTRRIAEQEGLKQGSLSSIIFSNSINMIPEGMSRFSKHFVMGAPKVQTGAPGTYIDLVMFTWEGEWHFDWNYVRDLFNEDFIKTIANQYSSMLEQLAQRKGDSIKLSEFTGTDIMPEQYIRLYEKTNETTYDYPVTTVNQWIKETATMYPQNEAISFEDKSLCYAEFYAKANQFAHLLVKLGIKPGKRVALLMNRTLDLPVAQLAILIAGGTYVPIDPMYPVERIKYMLEDCGTEILISQKNHAELITQTYTPKLKHCILTDADKTFTYPINYNLWVQGDIACQSQEYIEFNNTPDDLIYIIYTSGSTGQPKGTMLRHRNVCNFLYYVQQAFDVKAEDRFAFVTSYSFDMTVTSNWLPFLTGASLHILSEEKTRNVELLLRFIGDKAISFLNITPSHFSMLANTLEFTDEQIRLQKNMTIMLGAEIINVGDVNKWLSYFPEHKLINEYGPTETTVASTFFPIPVNQYRKCELSIVPIGKPIYNTQVYILNENNERCMPGVPGILHIGGAGVALGYLNKEERTNSVFIPNPTTGDKEDIVYNTGDLAKFTEAGDIIFIGRKDFQVNVRGYRIELGEIENALSKVPEIAENCADIQFDNNKQGVVVAFYTTKTKTALDDNYILGMIDKLLPQYMLPSFILHVEQIPVTPNGKTDRKSLPYIAGSKQIIHSSSYVPPTGKAEKEMAKIWIQVLDIPRIGIHDNFWEIGGDSIKSVRLVRELKAAGFEHIKLRDMFDSPTIFQMINRMVDLNGNDNILNLKSEPDAEAMLFCFPYAAGTAGMYASLSEDFEQHLKIQSAHYPGHGDNRPLKENIHDLNMLYFKELKENNLLLFLLGYSYGGYVAYDICRKLEELNKPVRGIILAGTTPPDIKDELMSFYLNHEADYERVNKDLFNQEFLDTLSDEEQEEYLKQLKSDTKSMLNYNFPEIRLKTPLLSIIGKDEETAIKEHQDTWEKYFTHVEYATLPGGHLLIKNFHKELAGCVETFINRYK